MFSLADRDHLTTLLSTAEYTTSRSNLSARQSRSAAEVPSRKPSGSCSAPGSPAHCSTVPNPMHSDVRSTPSPARSPSTTNRGGASSSEPVRGWSARLAGGEREPRLEAADQIGGPVQPQGSEVGGG